MRALLQAWSRNWRLRREAAALARRPIPERLWRRTLKRFPFLPQNEAEGEPALRRMTSLFLDRKEFTGAQGLKVTDPMAVAIAAQACLPVLALGLQSYDNFVGVVVHPGQAVARRAQPDELGLVHEYDEVLTGEAVHGGPVMLSWPDVRAAGAKAAIGYNVVIHEFAHVLDMADGVADGTPLLPNDLPTAQWSRVMLEEFERFRIDLDSGALTALDPYGAEAPDEFFAVSSESFFVDPLSLQSERRSLYDLLARYYRQDPATRLRGRCSP